MGKFLDDPAHTSLKMISMVSVYVTCELIEKSSFHLFWFSQHTKLHYVNPEWNEPRSRQQKCLLVSHSRVRNTYTASGTAEVTRTPRHNSKKQVHLMQLYNKPDRPYFEKVRSNQATIWSLFITHVGLTVTEKRQAMAWENVLLKSALLP